MADLDEDRKQASAWELIVFRILTALAYVVGIAVALLSCSLSRIRSCGSRYGSTIFCCGATVSAHERRPPTGAVATEPRTMVT
jgi:hypothetical protein